MSCSSLGISSNRFKEEHIPIFIAIECLDNNLSYEPLPLPKRIPSFVKPKPGTIKMSVSVTGIFLTGSFILYLFCIKGSLNKQISRLSAIK
jgi:hypothetical protein